MFMCAICLDVFTNATVAAVFYYYYYYKFTTVFRYGSVGES